MAEKRTPEREGRARRESAAPCGPPEAVAAHRGRPRAARRPRRDRDLLLRHAQVRSRRPGHHLGAALPPAHRVERALRRRPAPGRVLQGASPRHPVRPDPEEARAGLRRRGGRQLLRPQRHRLQGRASARRMQNLISGRKKSGASTLTQQTAKAILITTWGFKRGHGEDAQAEDRRGHPGPAAGGALQQGGDPQPVPEPGLPRPLAATACSRRPRTTSARTRWDLSLGEMSLLAGLPQSPSRYSPFKHPDAAKKRRQLRAAPHARGGDDHARPSTTRPARRR